MKINVLAQRLPEATAALDKLIKRANKCGAEISYTVGEEFKGTVSFRVAELGRSITRPAMRVPIEVTGAAPKINGWTFVAKIDMTFGDTNLITAATDTALTFHEYHTGKHTCQHCNKNRKRNDVFVCVNEQGERMTVGRACLRDFLGIDSPEKVFSKFTALRLIEGFAADEQGLPAFKTLSPVLETVLVTLVSIRLHGYRKTHDEYSTKRIVNAFIFGNRSDDIRSYMHEISQATTPQDEQNAVEILEKMRLTNIDSDYWRNVNLLCGQTFIEPKYSGILISAVYLATQPKETPAPVSLAPRSQFLFSVGERIREINVVFCDSIYLFSNEFGSVYLHIFEDTNKNKIVWRTNKGVKPCKGEACKITATVKEHKEYKNEKQTEITRAKIL
jgi:hypothetical protein